MFEIDNQHILVTGGSSGFGRHFARFLASNGAKVTLAARRAKALASAVAEIDAAGGKAQSVILDVTIADSIDRAMEEAVQIRPDPCGREQCRCHRDKARARS